MMRKGIIDWELDREITTVGGFSTTLTFAARLKLRAIVRKVHLAEYPCEIVTNAFCDSMIDVLGPETAAYLIRHNQEGRN